jgi:hemoglobin
MTDFHFDATAENLHNTLKELGVAADVINEVMTAVAGLREQVMCRGKWAIDADAQKPTLLERIGGDAAVDAAVEIFYKKMLSDDRVKRFFEKTNMVHQRQKQKNFLMYVLDGGNRKKWTGLSMDKAHRRLVEKEGMTDFHFDATAENLHNTLKELKVAPDVINEVMTAVAGLREQVMCRGQWAVDAEEKKSLYERLGGAPAVEAAVDKFYKRMLADDRVARFFKDTNMVHQRQKQINFMSYAFGSKTKYTGLAMDTAHRKLVRDQGMTDFHFDSVKQNLDLTLGEMGVPKDLRQEVADTVESTREQVMCRGKWAIPSN